MADTVPQPVARAGSDLRPSPARAFSCMISSKPYNNPHHLMGEDTVTQLSVPSPLTSPPL